MRIMYDSVDPGAIPADARLVAGYVNGRWKWPVTGWARFPDAVKVTIATQASVDDGVVLDVEPGAASPAEALGWVRRRRAAGVDPTVYCNLTSWPVVRAAFTSAGVAQPHYWVARYDNVPAIPAGAVAKQYSDPATSGGHFDLSAVAGYWPGVDPPPVAPGGDRVNDEEAIMLVPAGVNEHLVLPCAGRPLFFYLFAAYGRKIRVHQIDYVMATGDADRFVPGAGFDSGDHGTGIGGTPWIWDSDKPGPVPIPRDSDGNQPAGVVIRYTADHAFTAYCG
ncbi:MAG TPA: hypothetical protein VJT49_11350 [Amycolatopsis sp.]|uniref:hypothetical protein n=1 Tax=Amycolatopsis sp. TaxID=37632 RepID=UPI002B46A8C4|nr:hypothetical protein [Amycolatopsis sp.]HKS45686.1 hypothetical protein [Amycolatopsis sp.]